MSRLAFALALVLTACAAEEQTPAQAPASPLPAGTVGAEDETTEPRAAAPAITPGSASRAVARMEPLGASGVSGRATLQAFDEGVRVELRLSGLSEGLHGVHVHAAADCADAASAGHYAPAGTSHGDPEDPRPLHHLGDLGNIRAYDDGARLDRIFTDLRLTGQTSVVGRVLVVHAGQDDLNTQPSGGSGEPVACGLIQPAR